MVVTMLDGPNITHTFKQVPAMWLFIIYEMCPFIPVDLSFSSEIWKAATELKRKVDEKTKEAEATRRPGGSLTQCLNQVRGLRKVPSR